MLVFCDVLHILTNTDSKYEGLHTYAGKMYLYGVLLKQTLPNLNTYLKWCEKKNSPESELNFFSRLNIWLPASPEELNHRLKILMQSQTDISLMIVEGQKRTIALNNSDVSILPRFTQNPIKSLWDIPEKFRVKNRSFRTPMRKTTSEYLEDEYRKKVYPEFLNQDFSFLIFVPRLGKLITRPVQLLLFEKSRAFLAGYDTAAKALVTASLLKIVGNVMLLGDEISAVVTEKVGETITITDKPFQEYFISLRWAIFDNLVKYMNDPALKEIVTDMKNKFTLSVAHYNKDIKNNLIKSDNKKDPQTREMHSEWVANRSRREREYKNFEPGDYILKGVHSPYDPMASHSTYNFGGKIPTEVEMTPKLQRENLDVYEKIRFCFLSIHSKLRLVNLEQEKGKPWSPAIFLIIALNSFIFNEASAQTLARFFENNGSRYPLNLEGSFIYDCETSTELPGGNGEMSYDGLKNKYMNQVSLYCKTFVNITPTRGYIYQG